MRKFVVCGLLGGSFVMLAAQGCGSETSEGDNQTGQEAGVGSSGNGASGFIGGGEGGSSGAGGPGTSSGASGNGGNALDAGLEAFCAGEGSLPLPTGDGGTAECAGDIAKRVFNFAICSCGDLSFNNALRTRSINSQAGGNANLSNTGASVGVNGTIQTNNVVNVGGSLWSGSNASASNGSDFKINYNWVSGGNIAAAGGTVSNDVIVEGNFSSSQNVAIGNRLRTEAGSTASGYTAVNGRVNENIAVAPPCDCDSPIDVAAIVTALSAQNDNAEREVTASALSGDSWELTLECGRYYFSSFASTGSAVLNIAGRTVIAIAGDVTLANSLDIRLADGAELDLFIGGNVTFNGAPTIGDPLRPFATRIYVAGTSVTAAGPLNIAANLYAPNAAITLNNTVDMKGALFGKNLSFSGAATVQYDEAILDTPGCDAPRGCTSCGDCGNPNPACKGDGTCGPCSSDAECCAPLVCNTNTGECQQPRTVVN